MGLLGFVRDAQKTNAQKTNAQKMFLGSSAASQAEENSLEQLSRSNAELSRSNAASTSRLAQMEAMLSLVIEKLGIPEAAVKAAVTTAEAAVKAAAEQKAATEQKVAAEAKKRRAADAALRSAQPQETAGVSPAVATVVATVQPTPETNARQPVAAADWDERLDAASGIHYYHNRSTGETTWTRPDPSQLPASGAWKVWKERYSDEHKRKYWYNDHSKESTWHDPAVAGDAT